MKSEEPIPQDPSSRIQTYLDRLQGVLDPESLPGHDHFDRKERNLSMLKEALHKNFVIKPEEIPESYWETQARLAREQGHGDIEVTEEMQQNAAEIIIADQESSLDNWVDYLSSDDATYPLWLKYFAIRGVLGMSTYDKEKHQFNKRDKGTTAPFPDLDREALAYVLDAVEKRQSPEYAEISNQIKQTRNELKRLRGEYRAAEKQGGDTEELASQMDEVQNQLESLSQEQAGLVSGSLDIPDETRKELASLLQTSDFPKLYAWAAEKVTPAEENELLITEGEWIKYDQGSDATPLVQSLQGHGTGWCTAGESTARAQLEAGDFYVYYSLDKQGNPTVPRAAIRMEKDRIGEVRGIAPEQNLDPHIAKTVQEKMREFPDGAAYEKKALDMRLLTYVERKTKSGQALDKDDLAFLYEIDSKIEGFGYNRDPRIEELRSQRDPNADAPVVFDCDEAQIARNPEAITEDTKAYIGPLESGIFDLIQLAGIKYIYRSFPEGKIQRSELLVGGTTKEQIKAELAANNIIINSLAQDMLNSPDFYTLPQPEEIELVSLQVGDLGLIGYSTTAQIWAKATELGLELCPPEVGPLQRLKDMEQPLGDWYQIAMKQITDSREYPYVFRLERDEDGLLLGDDDALPSEKWRRDDRFVFRLRKLSQES